MSESQDILFEVDGPLGLILLHRPKALNALTLDMIRALDARLARWAEDPAIRAVVIRGAGDRAFCAGGDVRALYDSRQRPGDTLRSRFYREEYRMNRRIFRYPKPYIALVDGVVMGGGVGVSVHGSHRVFTERALFAMPETGIGLFPDVGGGYFLPRLPGETGMYLGLTGARLKAADCVHAGIATHFVPSGRLEEVERALREAPWGEDAGATAWAVLNGLAEAAGEPPLAERRRIIDRCFAAPSVEEILEALEREDDAWARETAAALRTKSPTSLKVAYRQIRAGAALDFEAVMTMEYRLSQRFMDGYDFFEGVRAILLDKDGAPRWRPARLEEVGEAEVEEFFAPLGRGDLIFAATA